VDKSCANETEALSTAEIARPRPARGVLLEMGIESFEAAR